MFDENSIKYMCQLRCFFCFCCCQIILGVLQLLTARTKARQQRGRIVMEFGEKIKYARKKLYMSQDMMAKQLGVAFATVNRWESGRCKPNYGSQKAFAEFCKTNGFDVDTMEDIKG